VIFVFPVSYGIGLKWRPAEFFAADDLLSEGRGWLDVASLQEMDDAIDDDTLAIRIFASGETAVPAFDLDRVWNSVRVAEPAQLGSVQIVDIGQQALGLVRLQRGEERLHWFQ
jgi:hypothetical protein